MKALERVTAYYPCEAVRREDGSLEISKENRGEIVGSLSDQKIIGYRCANDECGLFIQPDQLEKLVEATQLHTPAVAFTLPKTAPMPVLPLETNSGSQIASPKRAGETEVEYSERKAAEQREHAEAQRNKADQERGPKEALERAKRVWDS